ncbi:MAG: hypothetical protein AAGI23_08360 [Bacteroidota bacterium]
MKYTRLNFSLLMAVVLIGFSACEEAAETNAVEETDAEQAMEVAMETEIPSKRDLVIETDGGSETVVADLYIADEKAPLDFYTYIPTGFNVNITDDPEDNYSINFAREGRLAILTFLPKGTSEEQAIAAAKMRIEEAGTVAEEESGMDFYLEGAEEQVILTTLKSHNGQYYYWTRQYPTEDAFEFEPYAVMIMDNMVWK